MGARPATRDRDGRPAPAAPRRGRDEDLRRREAPRGSLQDPAREAGPAAPRRADESPRRRVRGVARAPPGRIPRHRRRGHARPLLPRQRRGLDPRARSRRRHPVEGQLLELARAEGKPTRARREGRDGQAPHAPARARMDQDVSARAACEKPRPHRPLRGAARRLGSRDPRRDAGALHPRGSPPGRRRRARRRRAQGLRRPAPDGGFELRPAARRHRRHHRRRTAPARRRSSR